MTVLDRFRLDGRRALVTGASRGLGWEMKQETEAAIPMGRWGEPAEIGPLAVYLASDASSYMTGSVIVMDGGRLL